MATLDNAIWLTGTNGEAEDGSTTITEGGNSTTIDATFTGNWDASQNGYAVSEFGAFGITSPITADFAFSNPVENLSFDLQHVNSSGSTYDDMFTIYAYDENGNLLPSADVIAGISGLNQDTIIVNPDGSVSVEGDGTASNNVTIDLPGTISHLQVIYDVGPDGTQTGGAGIGDLTFDIPVEIPCFTRGTMIATQRGQKRVEDLVPGDRVMTLDNGYQTLRWIGSRTVAARGDFAPIAIRAGEFGNAEDLLVSPQHRMLVTGCRAELLFGEGEVLCAAKHLVNGDTIYACAGGEVEYFHLLFDKHEIINANGAWAESYHPSDRTLGGMGAATRAEVLMLFPELANGFKTYGATARTVLRRYEAQMLLAS